MEVILLEKVAQLGDPGDLVNVKAGYGRNFLIPTGKAVRADEENKAEYEKRREALLTAEADRRESAEKLSETMESLEVVIEAQVSEEGTLYGSVGTREISDSLIAKGSLENPIKIISDNENLGPWGTFGLQNSKSVFLDYVYSMIGRLVIFKHGNTNHLVRSLRKTSHRLYLLGLLLQKHWRHLDQTGHVMKMTRNQWTI